MDARLSNGFDCHLDAREFVLRESHHAEGALSELAQQLVCIHAVSAAAALLLQDLLVPHSKLCHFFEKDRALLCGRRDKQQAVLRLCFPLAESFGILGIQTQVDSALEGLHRVV